jgi:aminoglycoside phosphotransferase (APT) family kinase protein
MQASGQASRSIEDFDPHRLEAFLRDAVAGLSGPMRLQRIGGGQSNPTYFVSFDDRALVLRKQPAGPVLPSAHAVDREYRIMKALAHSEVPVPETILYCEDRAILGTPFYLMNKVEGRVFPDYALPGLSRDERRACYRSMADTMARLHRADWVALGLSDFGKPGNYFSRQVARWSKQWQMS